MGSTPNIEQFDWDDSQRQLRSLLAVWLEDSNGIKASAAELERIVSTPAIRDIHIVSLYNDGRSRGEKAEFLYYKLGEMFGVGSKTVRYIVQRYTQSLCQSSQ